MKNTVTYYDLLLAHFTAFNSYYTFSTTLNKYWHLTVKVNIYFIPIGHLELAIDKI